MQCELEIENKGDHLFVTAKGSRSVSSILSLYKDVLAACEKEKVKKAMIDVCAMSGSITTMQAYDLSNVHLPTLRNRNVLDCVAVIDLIENKNRYHFLETAAVNRGFVIRYFNDPAAGAEWLRSHECKTT